MQKLAEICVRRPVFATMLIMTLVVLGIYSYNRLTVERFPRVEFPTIMVTTRLPGAAEAGGGDLVVFELAGEMRNGARHPQPRSRGWGDS